MKKIEDCPASSSSHWTDICSAVTADKSQPFSFKYIETKDSCKNEGTGFLHVNGLIPKCLGSEALKKVDNFLFEGIN